MIFTQGWWDDLEWYWGQVFEGHYEGFLSYEITTPELDYYMGVDTVVLTFNDSVTTKVQLQLKASRKLNLADVHVNLSFRNNGHNAAFGTYFQGSGKPIDDFAFAYPFLGYVIFVDYDTMRDCWNNLSDWAEEYITGNDANMYYHIPARLFLESLGSYALEKTVKMSLSLLD